LFNDPIGGGAREVPYEPVYVQMPELPTQEVFNEEFNRSLRKSRELEQAFYDSQIAAETLAALPRDNAVNEAGGDDSLRAELETGSKSEEMVGQALEVSGADKDVVADAIPISGETDESPKPVPPPAALRGDGSGKPGGPITDAFNKFVNKLNKAISIGSDADLFKKHKEKLQKKAEKAKAKADQKLGEQNKEDAKKKYLQGE
jgi:hypothetical protein